MNNRLLEIRSRRVELQARISAQREQLAELGARWERPLAVADQGLSVLRFMRQQPVLVGVVAAVIVARRRSLRGVARFGFRLWRGYRLFRGLAAKLSPAEEPVQRL